MRFARWVFLIGGIYGALVLAPPILGEPLMARFYPPAPNHPELYYGFFGTALAWQGAFLIIAVDPVRYRPLMLAAMFEKTVFPLAGLVLLAEGRLTVGHSLFGFSVIDAVWLVLFAVAWIRTKPAS